MSADMALYSVLPGNNCLQGTVATENDMEPFLSEGAETEMD